MFCIKNIIKKIPFLYKPLTNCINTITSKRRYRAYRSYGKEAIQQFVNCMDKNGFKYTLAFGSILGAIREHGFIKHDLDIDVFMWYDDFNSSIIDHLKDAGFALERTISIKEDEYGREDTFVYKGVNIDIFYLYPAIDKYPYCCDFVPQQDSRRRMPRRIEIPIARGRRQATFEGVSVYIPDNAEEICEFRYGSNYMTPDPNWHWVSAYNAVKEWPEMLDAIKEIKS